MMRTWAALAAFLACASVARAQEEPLPGDPVMLPDDSPRRLVLQEEGVELNFNPPRWMGLTLRASLQAGGGDMNVAKGKVIEDFAGARPPLEVTLDHQEREYEAVGIGLVSDYDLFRLSLDVYVGEYEGKGTLTVDDGIVPATTQEIDLEGDFFAFRFQAFLPVLRARTGGLEVALGPAASAGLHLSEPDAPPEAPLELKDDVAELVGAVAPRLTIRLHLNGIYLSAEAEVAYLFGSTTGLMEEVSFGGGIRF